ncbi:MAG: hypothetical protein WC251_03805 [Candidatus Izemoplasmatales bacterium]|jgi:hypothetical protein
MSKCKICGCTDDRACEGGCFWIDKNETVCSECARIEKIVFENKITGARAIILACQNNEFAPKGLAVRIKYNFDSNNEIGRETKMFVLSRLDFVSNYKIIDSRVLGKKFQKQGL